MFGAIAAKIGESMILQKIKGTPAWVYWLVTGCLLAVSAFWLHSHLEHNFEVSIRANQKSQDDKAHQDELAKAHQDALNWKSQYITASTKITTKESADHEATVDLHSTLAGGLLAYGPGKASCGLVGSTTAVSSSSQHSTPAGTTVHAEVGPMSVRAGSDLIAVPRDDLIAFARWYDDNRDEVKTWRNDKKQQEILYEQLLNDRVSGK